MDEKEKKIQLLKLDELASLLFIGAILISIFLTQNFSHSFSHAFHTRKQKKYGNFRTNFQMVRHTGNAGIVILFIFLD